MAIPIVFYEYGSRTWSLKLREKHRLRGLSRDNMLRRISAPKREEITGGLRKLHNGKLHILYCSPDFVTKSRLVTWAGHVACTNTEYHIRSEKTAAATVHTGKSMKQI